VALRIVEATGRTDVGRQRQSNEDSYLESSPLFGVADGMGGARAGEVASRIAVETLTDGATAGGDPGDAEGMLAETARTANQRIYELAQSDESRSGMGTTLTAVLVEDGNVVAGHVGDSRLYRLRKGRLERLTRDHSLVEELVRRGELDPEEAKDHPQRSIITRALGPEPEVDVETFTSPGKPGDVYLLCSDGLTTMVSEERVGDVLREASSLELAAGSLVEAANEAGGRDNITVVLFRLGEENSAAASVTEQDTLSGQDTRADLHGDEVRAAAAAADEDDERPSEGRSRTRRSNRRRWVARVAVLLVVVGVVVGGYVAMRQVYFVGANDRGLVTLYRGLPYDLPLGIQLYTEEYVSTVAADSIQPPERREAIVDQQLRDYQDASDLVSQVEDDTLAPPPSGGESPPADGQPPADRGSP
jgi:serine/threonine protein phosphatase PrpC